MQQERRMAAREYAEFCRWMVEHLGDGGQGLVDTFRSSFAAKYDSPHGSDLGVACVVSQ